MKLPTFEEAKQALIERRGTPLDKFVAYWEPRDGELFREMLAELMEWAIPTCAMSQSEIEEAIADLPRHQEHMAITDSVVIDVAQYDVRKLFWNPTTGLHEEMRSDP